MGKLESSIRIFFKLKKMTKKKVLILGIVFISLGIIFGAFGAHGLKNIIQDVQKLNSFETGIRYQIYMGFSFLWYSTSKIAINKTIVWLWSLGALFFCFSIYLLVLSEVIGFKMSFLGPLTPLGGLSIVLGWFILLFKIIRNQL